MDCRALFPDFPDDARLWSFMLSRPVEPELGGKLLERVRALLAQWSAHGKPLRASSELLLGRFLFVAANEEHTRASGCSIDYLTRGVGHCLNELGLEQLRHASVLLWVDDQIITIPFTELGEMFAAGRVNGETVVFNTLLNSLGELRSGKWEIPLKHSVYAARLAD